ncbi:hypothetical protein U9M48_034750 [Paspalum notatum var. saurae]|uniref:Glutathione S-transferase n=1 Tax=Paspalum notatum var. saurae TaxID=547442 RepID=A0AAQ3UDU1_PASNO
MDHHHHQAQAERPEEAEEEKEKVTLHGFWSSPYVHKVIWALQLKGVDYDYVEEDLGNKSAQLLEQLNPVHGKVPVLVHRGKPVAESDVIVEFIDDAWNNRGRRRILPEDPYERAMARLTARFQQDQLSPAIWRWFTTSGEEQEAARDAAVEQLLELGFADLSLGPLAYVVPIYEEIVGVRLVTEERFPSLTAWMARFLGSPVVRDHLPPMDQLRRRYQAVREAFLKRAG